MRSTEVLYLSHTCPGKQIVEFGRLPKGGLLRMSRFGKSPIFDNGDADQSIPYQLQLVLLG